MVPSRRILVYASWQEIAPPQLMGILNAVPLRGKEIFSFEYNEAWLSSGLNHNLDPDLHFYSGPQYSTDNKKNFGMFLDSSPDRWGETLMRRREAIIAKKEKRKEKTLLASDFLLGVYDGNRMGALRFKEDENGPFLNDYKEMATPPWAMLRELEQASLKFEQDNTNDPDYLHWINMLIAPGSSLGGARPKASIMDTKGNLWIAKFPSKNDDRNIGAWEMIVNELAITAGLNVAFGMAKKFNSLYHTFLSKRFDRTEKNERIHFASAMTLLGYTDGKGQEGASYLDIASFIINKGEHPDKDLEELWRRIVFNICIKNTDDHLRNHGFLLGQNGWNLSPSYDLNPIPYGHGLSINISEHDNALDLNLAMNVSKFFRLDKKKAIKILTEVKTAVEGWRRISKKYEISKTDRDRMEGCFQESRC